MDPFSEPGRYREDITTGVDQQVTYRITDLRTGRSASKTGRSLVNCRKHARTMLIAEEQIERWAGALRMLRDL